MISNIHGKMMANDSYTGESFCVDIKFKIPTRGGQWKGCFATPSTALGALEDSFAFMSPPPTTDEIHELRHIFQSSLVKNDPENKYPVFEIRVAPRYELLAAFGGAMDYPQYHAEYGHDIQRQIYAQVLTKNATIAGLPVAGAASDTEAKDETAGVAPAKVNMWHTQIMIPAKEPTAVGFASVPRGIQNLLDFFEGNNINDTLGHAVLVYIHPKEKMFAIGSPTDWGEVANKAVTDLWNKLPVYGPVVVFRKDEFKSRQPPPAKRQKKEPAPKDAQDQATQTAQPALSQ